MSFDGKPSDYEKPDVFSLEGLIAWLETQPPETRYDYNCIDGQCLIGRYLLSTTGKTWGEHGLFWIDIVCRYPGLSIIAVGKPWTYGAALERARALAPVVTP